MTAGLWISAQAETFEGDPRTLDPIVARKLGKRVLASKASVPDFLKPSGATAEPSPEGLPAHQFPGSRRNEARSAEMRADWRNEAGGMVSVEVQRDLDRQEETRLDALRQAELDREAELRQYRGRTQNMLRRYMRYSLEAGRLPSILGSEFFRTRVTSYSVVTFEDRVIFVHDMEICLEKLSELSRQILARYVLQGHSVWETARLVHSTARTTRRNIPLALDELSEILLRMGLMEEQESHRQKSCQEGKSDEFLASDSEQGK